MISPELHELSEREVRANSRAVVKIGWDDCPWIDDEEKELLLVRTPPHLREARRNGTPSMGSGNIYPLDESEIKVPPMKIQPWWRRMYGMDVGWNNTSVIWGAIDPDTNVMYLYDEYVGERKEPIINAEAIKSRGEWIPGTCDPAGTNQQDGSKMFDIYRKHGLKLRKADKSIEAGIATVWEAMSTGKLKVFSSLSRFFEEYKLYRRKDNGDVLKENDHLMDAMRYLVLAKHQFGLPPRGTVNSGVRKRYDV